MGCFFNRKQIIFFWWVLLGCGLKLLLLFLLLRPHDYQVTLFIQCFKCHNQFSERCIDLDHNYCHVGRKFLNICKTVISQGIWYCNLLYICCDFIYVVLWLTWVKAVTFMYFQWWILAFKKHWWLCERLTKKKEIALLHVNLSDILSVFTYFQYPLK